jgi:hypothetical protein
MYNFELTYIPSMESKLKEIRTDASLFMDLDNVRFCECVSLCWLQLTKDSNGFLSGQGQM